MILGFVENLMFASRIETAVEDASLEVTWAEPLADWMGPSCEKIAALGVDLILLDLGITELDWPSWIRAFKSHPATAAIPLVCFGSHKDVQGFKAAKQAGADQVLARSQFFSKLPEILSLR
jgi:CheY-like chemotaxis protein